MKRKPQSQICAGVSVALLDGALSISISGSRSEWCMALQRSSVAHRERYWKGFDVSLQAVCCAGMYCAARDVLCWRSFLRSGRWAWSAWRESVAEGLRVV
eukprot:6182025-Pleurochrysis_carterae.AAC.2